MSTRASKIIYLNSEDRISGSASNFLYAVDIPNGSKFDTCCVLSMTIPRSYYIVRDGYNRAKITIDGVSNEFEVPPGNYNVNNFATLLLALLAPFGTFTMTFSTITGKYTYGYTGAATTVAFVFEDPSRLGHQMGFDEVSENHFNSGALQSANVVNFVSTSTLFLHSDMVDDGT